MSRKRRPANKTPVVGIVCEGPTDIYIARAFVERIWPKGTRVLPIQPELDGQDNPLGKKGGWTAVKQWCEATDVAEILDPIIGDSLDALIVVVDVDIAVQAGIVDPPSTVNQYATKRLCDVTKRWLDAKAAAMKRVVIGIPAMATEAWVVAALYPTERSPEAIADPAAYLADKGKLRRKEDGKPSKFPPAYRDEFAPIVKRKHASVRKKCAEAQRFAEKLEATAPV